MCGESPKRTETDSLGEMQVSADSLCGISGLRAHENFGCVGGTVHTRLLQGFGLVKKACCLANTELGYIAKNHSVAIVSACEELSAGKLIFEYAPAALQGGAGTSTNMYVNELIANRALELLGESKGDYAKLSPLGDVNLHQSTNDTYPTALRISAILACDELQEEVSFLADAFQRKEKEFADIVKPGRTELNDAVLTTLGREMGSYAEAFSRDRWRLSKCRERLRVINLGGTAIGTAAGADRKYIFLATEKLRQVTNLPLARAENLISATQNHDEIVEVSGFLKTLATNLFKISSDLRLLASGPKSGFGEIRLPVVQPGSSIMPGKVNPVIAEMAGLTAIQALSRDNAISLAACGGQLELNAFLPGIAHNLLCMIDELIFAVGKFRIGLVEGIIAEEERCRVNVDNATAVITAFVNKLGYDKCSEIVKMAAEENRTIKDVLTAEGLCSEQEYDYLTSSEAVLSLGFVNRSRPDAKNT
jgi:aspartate ammonia-lyase